MNLFRSLFFVALALLACVSVLAESKSKRELSLIKEYNNRLVMQQQRIAKTKKGKKSKKPKNKKSKKPKNKSSKKPKKKSSKTPKKGDGEVTLGSLVASSASSIAAKTAAVSLASVVVSSLF